MVSHIMSRIKKHDFHENYKKIKSQNMDFMKIAILEILRNMPNHKQNHRFSRHEKFQKTRFGENAETTDTIFFCNSA